VYKHSYAVVKQIFYDSNNMQRIVMALKKHCKCLHIHCFNLHTLGDSLSPCLLGCWTSMDKGHNLVGLLS